MRDKKLYARILGIEKPWFVREVDLQLQAGEVIVYLDIKPGAKNRCPICNKGCSGYVQRKRRWGHLDTCQYKTIVEADVPRVECAEHGIHQVSVPWAEPGSRFTVLFEALVIDWLQEASVSAVGRQLSLSWDEVDGILSRAVKRGLARRERIMPSRIGVDETSFQKRHEYVTVVTGHTSGSVLFVADDRCQDTLDGFYASLDEEQLDSI